MILPLKPQDILVPDTIVEVVISRKLRRKQEKKNAINFIAHEKSILCKKRNLFSGEILVSRIIFSLI